MWESKHAVCPERGSWSGDGRGDGGEGLVHHLRWRRAMERGRLSWSRKKWQVSHRDERYQWENEGNWEVPLRFGWFGLFGLGFFVGNVLQMPPNTHSGNLLRFISNNVSFCRSAS